MDALGSSFDAGHIADLIDVTFESGLQSVD